MVCRASLGTLAIVEQLRTRPPRQRVIEMLISGLIILVTAVFVNTPRSSEARPAYDARLPLVMRSVPQTEQGAGTSCQVIVLVEDQGGQPIAGARIVGLYAGAEGGTTSELRVTDKCGEVVFPGSATEIIFEVQWPVGILPCVGSSPRIQVAPSATSVKFVGCRP